jgi:transposase
MANVTLNNDQWNKIKSFLRMQEHVYIGQDEDCRTFLEALVWIARSGAQWRLLPERYGSWNSVYKRFSRWEKQGVFNAMMKYFSSDPDLKNLMLDSTITRAHSCAAGALKKTADRKFRPSDVPGEDSAQKSISWSRLKASRLSFS